MMSLPIPDKNSQLTYGEINGCEWLSIGEAVSQLKGWPKTHRAHLDPDLVEQSLPRKAGWKAIFGQEAAAEGHLRNQGVGEGDLFLFFGLFRPVEKTASGWHSERGSRPIHAIFGWLQIGDRVPVASWPAAQDWALYHPHFRHQTPNNVIYVSADHLSLGSSAGIVGAGIFPRLTDNLRLTAPSSDRPGCWLLPEWFYPAEGRSPLSYHGDLKRWRKVTDGVSLDSVSRGQEFVLDCDDYPEADGWLKSLLCVRNIAASGFE
jgi:hypothetical protein